MILEKIIAIVVHKYQHHLLKTSKIRFYRFHLNVEIWNHGPFSKLLAQHFLEDNHIFQYLCREMPKMLKNELKSQKCYKNLFYEDWSAKRQRWLLERLIEENVEIWIVIVQECDYVSDANLRNLLLIWDCFPSLLSNNFRNNSAIHLDARPLVLL